MSSDWQTLVSTVLVLLAFGYSAWRLMPVRWRQALQRRCHLPEPPGCASGCSACQSGCATPAEPDRTVVQWHPPRQHDAR